MNRSEKSLAGAWLEAARPKTLPASVSPVLLGCAMAYFYNPEAFDYLLASLCLIVALAAQIASNFANDYFDFKKGADTAERLGPERAVAQGWIKPKTMLKGTSAALMVAIIAGLWLVALTDWRLLWVGVAIAIGVLAYSAGPFPLAYNGLGDVCVLLFYGMIPVCFTYYVQTFHISLLTVLLSVALGLLSINILVVNNYRDYEQDKAAGKRTSIVLLGRRFGRGFYISNQIIALIITFPLLLDAPWWMTLLFGGWLVFGVSNTLELFTNQGKALNRTLGRTAQQVFLYALILVCYFIHLGLTNVA